MICLPKKALRCWRYVKTDGDGSQVPRWVAVHLMGDEKRIKFCFDGGGDVVLDDGDVVVELDPGGESVHVAVYSPDSFAESFDEGIPV